MPRFAILIHPTSSRVYGRVAPDLCRRELAWLTSSLCGSSCGVELTSFGGLPYLIVEAEGESDTLLQCLSNLSGAYALFRFDEGRLEPLSLSRADRYDDDLLTILKYSGKTNETFTKMLVNLTLVATGKREQAFGGGLEVLDPMCGRGTTLNQLLTYGHHAAGIEIDRKAVEAYGGFLQTWLKEQRLKHNFDKRRDRSGGRDAMVLDVQIAHDKEALRAGRSQRLRVVAADTREAPAFFKKGSLDAIVVDLPYGVQHAGRDGSKASRSPGAILAEAALAWRSLLVPKGAIGISWNTKVLPRDELAQMLVDAGLTPVADLEGVSHRVDHATQRDLIVAVAH